MGELKERIALNLIDTHGQEKIVFFEPSELDAALIGIALRIGLSVPAYDYDKLIEVHRKMGMSYQEAEEWVTVNTMGRYVGPETPVVVWRPR
jgi:hypothetical protein